jgi:hypothetical protein
MSSLDSKNRKYVLITIISAIMVWVIIALASISVFSLSLSPAYAHITKQFGNISLEVGWTNEPPLTGQLNSAIIVAEKAVTGGNFPPINNALSQMNIAIKYGGISKPLDFEPSEQAEGGYEAKIIPTRIGSYNLAMNGTIQNQNITNVEIPLDEVAGTQMFSFPDRQSSVRGGENGQATSNNSNDIGAKVEQILSQLSTDIDSTKANIAKLDSSYTTIQKSIQDAKSLSDRSFMIGLTGIGAGIAAIIISSMVLSRRG